MLTAMLVSLFGLLWQSVSSLDCGLFPSYAKLQKWDSAL